ncbi:transforming growth factor beta-1 proprotein-like [Ochotona princeps]|uniref:transforming growth factor beta-1 proprotein-like n=1 Tax=Ochotona princeps TaxID=9978 RepID=UPI002714734F|nr:transforming growth factor beta-1 proprotein-like [Ochotona princeps]
MSTLYNRTHDGVGNETTTEEPEGVVNETTTVEPKAVGNETTTAEPKAVGNETTTAEPKAVGNETTTVEPEEEAEYYPTEVDKVLMVGTRHAIYKQFRKSPHHMYMVFNKTELQKALPEPSILTRAELELHRIKQNREQAVLLFERYGKKSWRFIRYWVLAPSNTAEWLSFDVTAVVCQWMSHRNEDHGEFEVFRLTPEKLNDGTYTDILQMQISGITPSRPGDLLDNDGISIYQPILRLITTPMDKARHLKRTRRY